MPLLGITLLAVSILIGFRAGTMPLGSGGVVQLQLLAQQVCLAIASAACGVAGVACFLSAVIVNAIRQEGNRRSRGY